METDKLSNQDILNSDLLDEATSTKNENQKSGSGSRDDVSTPREDLLTGKTPNDTRFTGLKYESLPRELSEQLKYAVIRASDLTNYTREELAATDKWIVGLSDVGTSRNLAPSLGAKQVQSTGYIPNTYVWQFSARSDANAIAKQLQSLEGVTFFYPLVPRQQQTRSADSKETKDPRFIPNDPLFTQQWHLKNTGQTGGTPGADANVETAWNTVKGEGAVIGIVDDGLQYTHPDLNPQYQAAYSYDFNFNDPDPSPEPCRKPLALDMGMNAPGDFNRRQVPGFHF
ncbi:hypothetical protein H6S82_19080 [Planktothrix sp. FACHB-1355]|uniref:Peptidase S8/S53 domain-containing protein n=1 Tax=Aerosakkonema funiforme FACHB-1375 TaxID=2949571 RepID=A0A926ZK72_9CYAN|nr:MULTISPECIES: S8 family serine peptidase [Oscillatoriales]MBD2186308.1 hypothetical protein [Aerosakkonema funiforme FACHB-1375]MBD3560937.1 hypothetical protein [Planktothrix sp. FACHB-1355]